MPAAATATKPVARSAPRRVARAAPAPRRAPRPAGRVAHGRLVPVAVGRTAVAVGGIADSGLVLGLTRSRLWIGLLAGLLVGIVGLNVMALQLNATASKTAGISDELKRENSALQAEIQSGLSNERLQQAALRSGLVFPEPEAILNLTPRPGDAAAAAARLEAGEIALGGAHVPTVATPVVQPVVADPAATAAVETEALTGEPAETTSPPPAEPIAAAAPAHAAPVASGGAMAP